ncbi:Magnesium transporter MgtE [Corynebacterium occultum]|uniref:Magnesium transporter MgtE n=1 Tax=Corynebacterium occultum TaxID=2675219 RepID=A0A6B8VWN5_9CORY|nr:magnesium transporter [Corynebacterium occultum]QGU08543.1 Magnesium transporter MgtE [Corynebacterium occultum]
MSVDTLAAIRKILRGTPSSEEKLAELSAQVQSLPESELAYLMDSTPPAESAILFLVLSKEQALQVFAQASPVHQAQLIETLQTEQLSTIVTDLDPDDRALLFGELPATVVKRLMRGLSHEEQQMTASLLGYPKDAIGRYMSPEVLALPADLTVAQAREYVRERIDGPETIYVLPVVDGTRRLLGVLSLRELLGADPAAKVLEISNKAIRAQAVEGREDVVRRFRKSRLLAMPIVDSEERLLGILTVDDAMSIQAAEDEEDAARTAGSEPLDQSYLSVPIRKVARSRVVWLVVLAVSAILTVQVLELYEDRLNQVVALALFIPLLTGAAGNTGNQAATTVTRALAVGSVRVRDLPRVAWRELRVGFALGFVLGVLGLVVAGLVYGVAIGVVIGLTLLSICTMAAAVGGIMPLIAKRVGADPAVFSNPFISTFCDATGLIIYFSIASAVLGLN